MRTKQLLFILIIIVFSCQKEIEWEGNGSVSEPPTEVPYPKGSWEFKESEHFTGPVDTAFLTKENANRVLTVNGHTSDGQHQLLIRVSSPTGSVEKKTYNTTKNQVKFLYKGVSDTVYYAIPYLDGDIYVTITEIDDKHVKGTFKGIAIDKVKKSRNIVDGKFDSPLKVASGTSQTGQVMLWAAEDCNGPIQVKVNNQGGEISIFSNIPPDCGEAGRATFTLRPGEYKWAAYCGGDSVTGKVHVKADSCSSIKVIFPFRPAPETTTNDDSCKVQSITGAGTFDATIFSEYEVGEVKSITFPVDVYNGYVFFIRQEVVYAGDTVKIWDNQYFLLDASGKPREYVGLLNPAKRQSQTVRNVYTYDNAGHLIKADIYKTPDNFFMRGVKINWGNNNIQSMMIEYPFVGWSTEIVFEYYTDKLVRGFPYLFKDIPELFYFQTALNFKGLTGNAVKSITTRSFDRAGEVVTEQKYLYENYVIDANKYVQQVTVRDPSWWQNITNYQFDYICF
jgi:hypothetical protein